jgi:hypothetical protein
MCVEGKRPRAVAGKAVTLVVRAIRRSSISLTEAD